MNLCKALEELLEPKNKEMWMRPKNWKGRGCAYALDWTHKSTQFVPGVNGGIFDMTYSIYDLLDEWEIVSAQDVLGGK